MGRKAEPGITYYSCMANHTANKKIRLLFNEFKADGYWILKCLWDKIYSDRGYYYDVSNEDELELFATDVCKMQVALVKEVVKGCVRRGLFDESVFNAFQILTSDRIQFNYLDATYERRRKGTPIELIEELLVIAPDEAWNNVIYTRINDVYPRKKAIVPRNNPQSIGTGKSKGIGKGTPEIGEAAGAAAPEKSFKSFSNEDFALEILKFKDLYDKKMRDDFYKYWREKNAKGVMRFQLEKTWETALRLEKWKENQKNFEQKNERLQQNTGGSKGSKANAAVGRELEFDNP